MTAPTQQLPSWLSLSSTVITDASGNPIATSTTLLHLPLTYYGPSIPLGTDGAWTYGGLTSPASTSGPTPTSTITAIPSSSTSVTATPNSSTVTFTQTSSPFPSSAASSSDHHRDVLIGAIVGSVLGGLFLLLALFLLIRWWTRGDFPTPIWTGWDMVEPPTPSDTPGERQPGEGSPRGSGEEADSFLQRSNAATDGMRQSDASARLVSIPSATLAQGGAAAAGADPDDGSDTSSTGSGYGTVIHPGRALGFASLAVPFSIQSLYNEPPRRGHIVPPRELLRIEEEHARQTASAAASMRGGNSPLMPPPPLDPDRLSRRGKKSAASSIKSASLPRSVAGTGSYPTTDAEYDGEMDADENVTFLTARRVQVGARSPPPGDGSLPQDVAGPSWSSAIGAGIGSLARLSGLSWLSNSRPASRATSRSRSRPTSLIRPTDTDLEAGTRTRVLLTGSRTDVDRDSKRYSRLGDEFGFNLGQGERPISTLSTKSASGISSGNSVYHDARSSPGTPLPTPLPRAATPPDQQRDDSSAPPAYGDHTHSAPYSPAATTTNNSSSDFTQRGPNVDLDVLDMPAPPPISPFANAALTSARASMPFPPGLGPPSSTSIGSRSWPWRDSLSNNSRNNDAEITIDVLEEAPPVAGEGWRSLATDGGDRRTTFGTPQFVHPRWPSAYSEAASIHSMQDSYLSPRSGRTSGSTPGSHHTSQGSASSRPSRRTGSSGASLAHSGSVSSDGRRRGWGSNPNVGRASVSAMGYPSTMPLHHPPRSPLSASDPATTGTIASVATTTDTESTHDTSMTHQTDPAAAPTGGAMHFPGVPWTPAHLRVTNDQDVAY